MAHVGTTTNLKQPAATGSGQRAGVWMAVFAAAVIAAIALAFVMTQLVGSKTTHGALGGDLSYAQIEALRGASVPFAVDRSYDQIEAQRGISPYLAPNLLDRGADRGGSTQPTSITPRHRHYEPLRPAVAPAAPSLQLKNGFNRDLQP
jgi:hypothetical protein